MEAASVRWSDDGYGLGRENCAKIWMKTCSELSCSWTIPDGREHSHSGDCLSLYPIILGGEGKKVICRHSLLRGSWTPERERERQGTASRRVLEEEEEIK